MNIIFKNKFNSFQKLLNTSTQNYKRIFNNSPSYSNVFSSTTRRDDVFTISLIGRPNVGKSTLFNRLAGEAISLIDNTPGLTRDRKEAIVNLFGMKIRIVDTAGIDDFEEKISYDELLNKTIFQTRQALIYSDLAFFLLDGKAGVTHNDIKLAKWLNNLRKKDEKINEESEISGNLNETSSEKFYEKLKKIKEQDDIKIPKIILVANKVEDDFIPDDIFCDFSRLNLGDPLLISAQQGDNMHDIYNIIEENIPDEVKERYQKKVEKRVNRYDEYKEKMKQIFIESLNSLSEEERVKYSLSDWEEDFDYLNKRDIENNSDYDSDNDIDPIDTFVQVPKDQNLRDNMRKTKKEELKSIQNKMHSLKYLKKPIKIAVVGKQNVGKSSIVNSLLKENRVIISDVPGTTRDSIPIEWNYKGRRLILIDTAGLQAKNKVHDKIDKMISASTIKSIKYCHVVIYVIDSMEAFTPVDMKIINFIGEEGRALVVVANKWDLVENGYKTKAKKWMEDQLEKGCTHYKLSKINFVSARNFFKIDNIIDDVLNSYNSWNTRVQTRLVNEWVNQLKKTTNAPNQKGQYLKLKFVTQIKTRPPAFTVFVNNIDIFFKSHETFIKRMMVKEFNLRGSPIRLLLRDHKKIHQKSPFKKVSIATAKIEKKLNLMKKKMANPTYRRKAKGYDELYGKKSIYRQMKK